MSPLFLVLVKSFVITFLAVCYLRKIALKIGWVDYPGGRKKHQNPVPVVGGLAVFMGVSITLIALFSQSAQIFWLGCCALVLISCMDDRMTLRAGHRFVLHCIIVMLVAYFSNTSLSQLGNLLGFGPINLAHGRMLFTAFAVVGVINAVNMMDGMDGLTACVSLAELGLLLFLALSGHFMLESLLITTCMGALLAFLCFNFPNQLSGKYKVFLGDTGSMFIGLILAWLCTRLTQTPAHLYPPVLMLWIVALPVMDTLHVMLNRKARGVSVFKPDRRHIHHILLGLGFHPRQIVAILTLVAFSLGLMGIFLSKIGTSEAWLLAGIMLIFCLYYGFVLQLKKRLTRSHHPLTSKIESNPFQFIRKSLFKKIVMGPRP